ncbi:hypothetical protein [Nocardia sp. NPDC057030]|uniref:hypothetical protein n=1 Tax=unclassified Nocardia TaxID=2637762 RepID=UPI00362F2B31
MTAPPESYRSGQLFTVTDAGNANIQIGPEGDGMRVALRRGKATVSMALSANQVIAARDCMDDWINTLTAGDRPPTVEDLTALAAESVVIVKDSGRIVAHQKLEDGDWYDPIARAAGRGLTPEALRSSYGWIRIVHVGDRPIMAGMTEIEQVRTMAAYHGWRSHDVGAGAAKFDQNGCYINLRFSEKTGRLTKPPEFAHFGGGRFAPTAKKLWHVLQYLEDKGEFDDD